MSDETELDAFFRDAAVRRLFDALRAGVDAIGSSEMRVGRSAIAFARRRAFAWAWTPERWLRGPHAPLVVSIALDRREPSQRWKEVVEPRPGRFMHHLEVRGETDLDDEVWGWLREAWGRAG